MVLYGVEEIAANTSGDIHRSTAITQLHRWRVHSANFLFSLPLRSPADRLVERITRNLGPVLSTQAQTEGSNLQADEFATRLRDIVSKAASLDKILRTSKAFFQVCITPPRGTDADASLQFNAETMNLYPGLPPSLLDKGKTVDLVVSPALFKTGNADGKSYDKSSMLVKYGVICNMEVLLRLRQSGRGSAVDTSASRSSRATEPTA
jgi:hypothetical protein